MVLLHTGEEGEEGEEGEGEEAVAAEAVATEEAEEAAAAAAEAAEAKAEAAARPWQLQDQQTSSALAMRVLMLASQWMVRAVEEVCLGSVKAFAAALVRGAPAAAAPAEAAAEAGAGVAAGAGAGTGAGTPPFLVRLRLVEAPGGGYMVACEEGGEPARFEEAVAAQLL